MVENYDENTLLDFLDATIKQVVFNKNNEHEIEKYFIEFTNNDRNSLKVFMESLPTISSDLKTDLTFFIESDPAIFSSEEVLLAYPGYKAIAYYRIANVLNNLGYVLNARLITERAHTLTGIDIHPAAQISCPFFIDHGTGIVIGETSIIGKNVKLYQGVTLGALSLAKGSKMRGIKRHPTIGNDVTIYAGASILGNVNIGNNVTIGSNVFLTDDVPDNTKVVISKPELILLKK